MKKDFNYKKFIQYVHEQFSDSFSEEDIENLFEHHSLGSTVVNKLIALAFCLVMFSCSAVKNENTLFRIERQKLLSKEFEVKLPIPFHTQKENYEEGIIYFYSFIDSAYIIVFQGALMEFPIDKYEPQRTEITNNRRISVGIVNNRYWRKDVVNNVRVYYDNVSAENKEMYDNILSDLKIIPL